VRRCRPTTNYGIDAAVVQRIAEEVAEARVGLNVELAIVVAAATSARMSGADARWTAPGPTTGHAGHRDQRARAADSLEAVGSRRASRPPSPWPRLAEPFIPRRAIRHLDGRGAFVVFAAAPAIRTSHRHHRGAAGGGDRRSGDPEGDALGRRRVYSADPRSTHRVKLTEVSHFEILNKGLKVMDSTAITFCMDNELPIVVFDVTAPGNIHRALVGERIGTLVSSGATSMSGEA